MATKFTGGTEAVETMTAMPTLTLTPAIPSDSPLCTPDELKVTFNLNGAMQDVLLGAGFTNLGNSPCYMQAWPQVILVDGQSHPLDVDYHYFDLHSDASTGATEQARDSGTAKAGLWPGWIAEFTLMWGNWCGKPVPGGAVIRLTLMNHLGTIHIPTGVSAGGTCNAPGDRSTVGISNLEVLPPPQ